MSPSTPTVTPSATGRATAPTTGSTDGPAATVPVVLPVDVLGIGAALPERVVTNDDLAAVLETSDEWIRTRTGIRERRIAAPDETTGTLALAAARAALADAQVDAATLGAVVLATTTPDRRMPGTAVWVADQLGAGHAPAFDIQVACAGFVTGLRVVAPLVEPGRPVLLIGAETLSRIMDHDDRGTAVLFGDGAGAVVLGTGRGGSIGPFDLGSDGSRVHILEVPGDDPPAGAAEGEAAGPPHILMNGSEVYAHAVRRMTASSRAVVAAAGLTPDDVDLVVGHQANLRILAAVGDRLGIPLERQHLTVDRHGNTSAASVPLALADAKAAGRLAPGTRVLTTAFGAGLSWASCLITVGGDA